MMKKILLALIFACVASVASAQTCPTRPAGDNSNACASTAFINSSTSGIFNLPHTWTALQTFTTGAAITGNFNILYPVVSNIVNARSSLHITGTSTSDSNAQFLTSSELISTTGSTHIGVDNDGDRVGLYASTTGRAGSGNIWAFNTVVQADSTAPSNMVIQGYELDFNNHNANRGATAGAAGLASPFAIAQTITGAGVFKSTAALMVATAVPSNIWYRGLGVAGGVQDEAFWDYSFATTSYSDRGSHTNGIDTKFGSYTGSAVRIGNGQKVSARNAADTSDLLLLQLDATDSLQLGLDGSISNIVLNRNTVPAATTTYNLGSSLFRYATIYASTLDFTNPIPTSKGGLGNDFSGATGALSISTGTVSAGVLPVPFGGTGDSGTAWTAFTPTLSCGNAGTLTSATPTGRWKSLGKTYFVQYSISITTNGTCATSLNATLPNSITAQAAAVMVGRETNITGAILQGFIGVSGTTVSITNATGAYPVANGEAVVMSGTIEAQ